MVELGVRLRRTFPAAATDVRPHHPRLARTSARGTWATRRAPRLVQLRLTVRQLPLEIHGAYRRDLCDPEASLGKSQP